MTTPRSLQLDGIDVRTSSLTQRAYRAASCRLLLPLDASNATKAVDLYERGDYCGLRLDGITDLGFLKQIPDLRYLELARTPKLDVRQLSHLSNLRGLLVESPGAGIDFTWFPQLEFFVGDWHKDNENLASCRELRQARCWQYKPTSGDLSAFAHTVRLELLSLTQSSVATLGGIETLEDLRYLSISHASKMESLAALEERPLGIREIEIAKANRLSSYSPLASLPCLRRLKISKSAAMPDLRWMAGMDRLDFFSFVGTNVIDGDLSPLLALPMLEYIGTLDKRHYSHKSSDLKALLKELRTPTL